MSVGVHSTWVAEGGTSHLLNFNKSTHTQPLLPESRILDRQNADFQLDISIYPSKAWNLQIKVQDSQPVSVKEWVCNKNALEINRCEQSGDSKACKDFWNSEEMDELIEIQDDGFEDKKQQEENYMDLLSLEEAIDVLDRTDELLSIESYLCTLQKCRREKNPQFGKHVYALMCKNGLEVHEDLGNHGVPMLIDCESLPEALQLFSKLVHVTEHAWTSLILGHAQIGQLAYALNLFQRMQEDCVDPSSYTLVTLLKTCARLNSVNVGQHLHEEIIKLELDTDVFVCNTLIHMYAKCGLLSEAQEIFNELTIRDVVSWNTLIAAYVEEGSYVKALKVCDSMRKEGVSPDAFTLACNLKACSSVGAVDKGRELHKMINEGGFKIDSFVGNGLIGLYARCGSLSEAREIFEQLPNKDVVSWSALIAGYAEHGPAQEALRCFERMQLFGVSPDSITYASVLRACASMGAFEKGQELHKELVDKALETSPILGNSLVGMYAKCGSFPEAHKVFNMLTNQDVVSVNALIAGYIEHGLNQEVLDCFKDIPMYGLCPDAITFACSFRACSGTGIVQEGQELHRQVTSLGLEGDILISNTLVAMYAKFGLLSDALQILKRLSNRDVVTWNALIAGYSEHGPSEEALKCFKQMQIEGIHPDEASFACLFKACSSMHSIDMAAGLRVEVFQRGLCKDLRVGNALIGMYANFGLLPQAQEVFDELPVRDVVSWNALISGYGEQGFINEVLKCYKQMQSDGFCLDAVTYACVMKACGSVGALVISREIHMEITKKGLQEDVTDYALVGMYAKCGAITDAQDVFDKLLVQDAISWTSLISGYAEHGPYEEALMKFDEMQEKGVFQNAITYTCVLKACGNLKCTNRGQAIHAEILGKGFEKDASTCNTMVSMYAKCGLFAEAEEVFDKLLVQDHVSWSALITGYTDHGLFKEALGCFERMQLEDVSPNAVIYASILKSCGSLGTIDRGQEVLQELKQRGFDKDPLVVNSLIGMFARCGLLSQAHEAFKSLSMQDTSAWSAMIQGYGMNHEGGMAVQCFEDMQKQNVKPDAVTFTCLLNSCSHTSLISKGFEYFKLMRELYGVAPREDHYTCLVDLLARCGKLFEAEKFTEMVCPFSEGSWLALLTACKTCGEVELGMRCFERLVWLNAETAAWYVIMADIYAGAGQREDIVKIEDLRKHVGAKKKPASALIEINKEVHEFVVGSNPNYAITAMLQDLNRRLKEGGHVPNLDKVLQPVCDKVKETALCEHAEKMAIAFGLLNTPQGETLRVTKNLRMCDDCHDASKVVSKLERREIILRDNCCIHHFKEGVCSCGDTF